MTTWKTLAGAVSALAILGSAALAQEGAELIDAPMDLVLGHDHMMIHLTWDHIGYSTTYAVIRNAEGTVHVDPVNPENSSVNVTLDMTSFDSFFAGRDDILKSERFLNVAAFPEATFVSTEVVSTGDYTADVTGDFTFMGMTYPLTLAVTFNKAGENMGAFVAGFDATTTIDRGDVGLMDIYPRVAPEIEVHVSVELELPE